jgi:beta-lactamase regulating signal transducer with metallopeptidase domain
MEAFIDTLLGRLLATSVQTVLLTAVVWMLCRCMPRLSPAAQCWLWWLVTLQAIVGLVADPIQLPWLPHVPPQLPAIVPATQWNAIPLDSVVMQPVADEAGFPWLSAIFLLWASGIAAMGWLTLRNWRQARQILRDSSPCIDEQLLQVLAHAAATRGLRHAPRLHLSRDIDSPLVVGHLRPVLLLPTRVPMSGAELDMVLAHELWHLRRGDLWWGCVPALARHLFFFHPCAHLAVREYGLAREADCDAAVVEVERHSRRDYGRLLLRLGTDAGAGAGLAVGSPTFHALNRRLTMLQNTIFLPRAGAMTLLVTVAAIGVMPLRLVAAAATPATPATPAVPAAVPAPSAASTPSGTRPDSKRKKEVLEAFALDTLHMAGLMRIEGQLAGLVRAPDGLVHRVSPGSYLGRNEGRVTRIEPARISITEIVPDGRGGFMERAAWLAPDQPAAAAQAAPDSMARMQPLPNDEDQRQRMVALLQALSADLEKVRALQQRSHPLAEHIAQGNDELRQRLAVVTGGASEQAGVVERQAAQQATTSAATLAEANARVRELERALNKMIEGGKQASTERMNLMAQQARPVPVPPAPRAEPVYTGEKMTANFQDVPTRTLLQLIGKTSGRNMLIDDAVTGTITLQVDQVPWDHLLDIVLRTKGLDKRVQGNLIIIGPAEKFIATEQPEVERLRAEVERLSTELARRRAQDAAAQSPTR